MKQLGLWSVMLLVMGSGVLAFRNFESKLYKSLIDRYDEWNPDGVLRPVNNASSKQHVMFGLAVISIQGLDETKDIATFHTYERYLWKDFYLQWNPSDFGGIDQMRIPIDKIWKPDIMLYNGYTPSDIIVDEALAVVSSDGTVLYIPAVYRNVPCKYDVKMSSLLVCRFKYGSWTYDGFTLDLDFYDGLQDVDLTDYILSDDFTIVSHSGQRNVKYFPCCEEPYIDLTFSIDFNKSNACFTNPLPHLNYYLLFILYIVICVN